MFTEVLIEADPFGDVDLSRLKDPPESLLGRRPRLVPPRISGGERRQHPRFEVEAIALVRPIDTAFRPTRPPFRAVVADISTAGLRLLHTRHVGAHLLAVQLVLPPGRNIALAMSVLRSQPARGCFEIAGQILARLDRPTCRSDF